MKKGSITVFFSLIFTVVLALICTVIESARLYAALVRAKSVSYTAMDNTFAGYARQLFDRYGVLAVWDEHSLTDLLESQIERNLGADSDTESEKFDLLKLDPDGIYEKNILHPTDDGGREFAGQILAYEKIEAAGDAAGALINMFRRYKGQETEELPGKKLAETYCGTGDEENQDLIKLAEDFSDSVRKLESEKYPDKIEKLDHDINDIFTRLDSGSSNSLKDTANRKSLAKKFKKLRKLLKEADEKVSAALTLSERYTARKRFFTESAGGLSSGGDDYIEADGEILRQIQEQIARETKCLESAEIIGDKDVTDEEKSSVILTYEQSDEPALIKLRDLFSKLRVNNKEVDASRETNIFEAAKNLVKNGVLGLVLPDNVTLSGATLPDGLPSEKAGGESDALSKLTDRALYVLYLSTHFGCFLEQEEESALTYELEYLVAGKQSDRDNLLSVATRLTGLRQVCNNITFLSDSAKMAECSSIAAAVSAATGLPFLEPVVKAVVSQAWVLIESVTDVRALLRGDEVALVKKKSEWRTSLANIGASLSDGIEGNKSADNKNTKQSEPLSCDYTMYLKLLLLTENSTDIIYRAMDLMQVNICLTANPSFKIEDCVLGADIEARYTANGLFALLPFVKNTAGGDGDSYTFNIAAQYSYGT